jgi:hypothetical protein
MLLRGVNRRMGSVLLEVSVHRTLVSLGFCVFPLL